MQASGIDDAGVYVLYEGLKKNKTLTTLHLNFNGIQDGEASIIAQALRVNSTLKTLSLDSNNIGHFGTQLIGLALKKKYSSYASYFEQQQYR